MTGFGVLLIIVGLGSLVLPMFNIQFTLMSVLEDYQPWAGIVAALIGVVLVAIPIMRTRQAAMAAPAAAAPSSAASAPESVQPAAAAPAPAASTVAEAGQARENDAV